MHRHREWIVRQSQIGAHSDQLPTPDRHDGQVRLLTKVARMYHERGIRQADIATALNISQAKVSRLLKRAEAPGIVRTTVTVAPGVLHRSSKRPRGQVRPRRGGRRRRRRG